MYAPFCTHTHTQIASIYVCVCEESNFLPFDAIIHNHLTCSCSVDEVVAAAAAWVLKAKNLDDKAQK